MSRLTRTAAAAHTLLPAALAAAVVVTGITHDAPVGGYVGTAADTAATYDAMAAHAADVLPTWTAATARAFPGCSAHLAPGTVPARVVAVTLAGEVVAVPFDAAWARAHNAEAADDLWAIGACA